jgi:LuxR family transcriptional regulator, maltose regulon positive regulatory protein
MHLIEASANSENERIVNDAEPDTPVAAAKVHVPAVPATILQRERLHALLDAAIAGTDTGPPVTVVRAPAGAGKTAMLATWARRQIERGTCVAWVSLDSEDNDPVLLWAAIVRALQMSGAWEHEPLIPAQRKAYSALPVAVIAAFERLAKPAVLILDGVQDVQSADSVRTLNNLLRHLPATLRVVLATRFPPPLILPRLQLEGRLHEIGPDQHTFTLDEARELFANEGIQLTESQLGALMERTEGWAAGLRLAAITFADAAEPDELITGFTGDDGVVADYLIGEVVARQPEDVQRFMLSTCVSGSFTAGLAAALSRQENAGQILDRLERTSILVGKRHQGRRWYRYHPLLRSYLLAELGRRQPSTQQELQHTAAAWFLASGDPLRAMGHGIAAADDDLVTRLIAKFGLEQILRGETDRLRRILDTAPAHVLARPSVALVAAATALDLDDLLGTDRILRRLENATHPLRSQRLRALHATVQLQRARPHGDLRAGLAALRTTRAGHTGDVDVDLLAMVNRGIAATWLGRHRAGKADVQAALQLATSEQRDAVTLHCQAMLAALAAAEGDLAQMSERAQAALDLASHHGWAGTSRSALPYLLLGAEAHERLETERARQLVARGTALLVEPTDPTVELFAHTLHAAVTVDTAVDPYELVAKLRARWQRLDGRPVAPALLAYVAPTQQRMALRVGEFGWAVEVLERAEKQLVPSGEQALLRAILHAHKGKVSSTRRVLAPVIGGGMRTIVGHTLIEAWLLEAHLADRLSDGHRAHEALSQALALAEPYQLLRPFRDAGQSIRVLLAQAGGRFGRLEPFAARVLAALPARVPDPTDALTEREQALLSELPSMRTAEEIATTMFVSVNTVKTHLRGIYRKLGVSHRRDAIAVARQRGLL